MPNEFPVANPIKHGRNYFVRRLHYAAGEVRSYTLRLYFPMHRTSAPTYRRKFAHAAVSLLPERVRHVPQPADGAPRPLRPRSETSVSAYSRGPHFWVSSDFANTSPAAAPPAARGKLVKSRFTSGSRSCASPVSRSRGSPAARGHFPLVPGPRISY